MNVSSPALPPITVSVCETDRDKADAFAVRVAVFVHEQRVPVELEADEYDRDALHLIARASGGAAVGTLRVVDKGNGIAKIGRVATLAAARGRGIGDALMRHALALIAERGFDTVILDAQITVIGFYERLGFVAEGPLFDDAGIQHRRMRRPTNVATATKLI